MGSTASMKDLILHQLSGAGNVTAKKMFGEYGLYLDGKFSALICDDTLFLKPTDPGFAFAPNQPTGQPYPNAKPHFQITAEQLENPEWLCEFLTITASALPTPKPKKKKT